MADLKGFLGKTRNKEKLCIPEPGEEILIPKHAYHMAVSIPLPAGQWSSMLGVDGGPWSSLQELYSSGDATGRRACPAPDPNDLRYYNTCGDWDQENVPLDRVRPFNQEHRHARADGIRRAAGKRKARTEQCRNCRKMSKKLIMQ